MDRLTLSLLLECVDSDNESVLTEPVSRGSGSDCHSDEEYMTPLRLEEVPDEVQLQPRRLDLEEDGLLPRRPPPRRPLQDLPVAAPMSTVARLALRVQEACAAAGNRPGDGLNSPMLNPLRQLQLNQQGQLQQQQRQVPAEPKAGLAPPHAQHRHHYHYHYEEDEENIPVDAAGRPLRYRCRACPARFSHMNLLSRHGAELHPVAKPFPCPGCGRGYVSRDVMEAHFLTVHQGERPFPCDQCDKVFSRREYLQSHGRVHTGERPYACPMAGCERRFAWRGSYDYHLRVHRGERPYVCLHCFKDFRDNNTRKLHEMIHTNTFPYPCDRCDRKFRRSHALREHAADHTMDDAEALQMQMQGRGLAAHDDPEGEDREQVGGVSRAEEAAAVAAVSAALTPAPAAVDAAF